MAAQTQMYFFNQRQHVVLLEAGPSIATRRYDIVYAKELTVSKGVDNLIEIAFINQDQKPVNVNGKEITARIISYDGNEVILQKTLSPIYPITGLMSLSLTSADLDGVIPQKAFYTLEVPIDNLSYPAFVDAQGDSRGTINIVDGLRPRFLPSRSLIVPSHPAPQTSSPTTYQSSAMNTKDESMFTLQVYYANFTGTTAVIGSTLADFSVDYIITEPVQYTDYTGTIGINVNGYHPYIKLQIENHGTDGIADTVPGYLGGDVTSVLYR